VADVGRIEQIIEQLKTGSTRRSNTFREYSTLINSGLTLAEGLRAIESSLEFPAPKDIISDNRVSMIGYLADSRFPSDHGVAAIPRILELYPLLSEDARTRAFWLLMNIPEREGAEAVMTLVRQYFHSGDIPDNSFVTRYTHPLHPQIYFPELLDYARLSSLDHAFDIWNICLKYCERGDLKAEQIRSRSSVVLGEYQTLKVKLLPIQSQGNWAENHEYLVNRSTAGLLLDLLRFFPTDEVKHELSAAVREYRDPVLLCWTCVAALWFDLPVDRDILVHIAADDESRKPFYEALTKQNRAALFPEQYRTKAAFAQSDMVDWLSYRTELGRAPDAIELTHIITEETDDGTAYEWFLFRFWSSDQEGDDKTDTTKWMAGWSGAFLKDDPPGQVLTPEGTFSHFHYWYAKTAEDHVGLNAEKRLANKRTVIEVNKTT
jgi:hypothetical protein